MLGIDMNIKFRNIHFPIYFDYRNNNQCVHCGSQNTLILVDKFGKPAREEIYPLDHIRCQNCGQRYTIKWVDEMGIKNPYAADPSIARQFTNYFTKKINKFLGIQ